MAPKIALNFQAPSLRVRLVRNNLFRRPAAAALRAELSDLRFEHFYLHRGPGGGCFGGTQGLSKVNLVKVFSFLRNVKGNELQEACPFF